MLSSKLVVMLAVFTSFAAQALTPNLTQLDGAIENALNEKRIAGAVVIVSHKGKVIYHKAKGLNDLNNNVALKEDALFRLSSLSKPIVAATVLSLVEKGLLDLNAPVTKYLPEFQPKFMGMDQVITIKHLLTHTAGLSYGFFEPEVGPYHQAYVSDGADDSGITLMENLMRLTNVGLLFPPGAAWLYSLGPDVVGQVIENVTGDTLANVVRNEVTGKLGMTDTDFVAVDADRLTIPYVNGANGPVKMVEGEKVAFGASFMVLSPKRALDEKAFLSAGSGMVGSAMDYLNFLETIRTGKLLSKESIEGLSTNQIGDLAVTIYPGSKWSLGFMVVANPPAMGSLVSPGTLQWGGGYGHTFWIDLKEELSVVIMTNTSLEGLTGKLPIDIQAALYQ
jgi:CubicO group peptidase (beta-lactamase class C family)